MAKVKKKRVRRKHRLKRILLLFVGALILWALVLLFAPADDPFLIGAAIPDLELPSYEEGAIVVSHPGYTLRYEEEHEQASWVAYRLTRADLYGEASERTTSPRSHRIGDWMIIGGGYDRGHLIPPRIWSAATKR